MKNEEKIDPIDQKEKICSCGFAQSFPLPHDHDLTAREKRIIAVYKGFINKAEVDAIADRQDIFDELRGLLKEHAQFPDMWDTNERLKEWIKLNE